MTILSVNKSGCFWHSGVIFQCVCLSARNYISLNEVMISESVCWHFDILARLPRMLPVSQQDFLASKILISRWEISVSISARFQDLAKILLDISPTFSVSFWPLSGNLAGQKLTEILDQISVKILQGFVQESVAVVFIFTFALNLLYTV